MNELESSVFLAAVTEPNDHILGVLVEHFGVVGVANEIYAMNQSARNSAEMGELSQYLFGAQTGLNGVGHKRASNALKRWALRAETVRIEHLLDQSEAAGSEILTRSHPSWPRQLGVLGHGEPVCLWVRGIADLAAESESGIAVVGSRAATSYGEHATSIVVAQAIRDCRVVISGGAFGIDAVAHRAALSLEGKTIAVMAGGIDRLYPAGNASLLRAIIAGGGAVVSEVPPGALPMKSRFLSRNRLIAALPSATVVVEAAWRSGSLSTAHHALELGRMVGAVPGPITSAQSAGCHRLFNEGDVRVIGSAVDVRSLYSGFEVQHADTGKQPFQDAMELRVQDAMRRRGSNALEEVAHNAGLTLAEAAAVMGKLESQGVVRKDLFGWALL